jgi:hypothetical protein
MATQAQIDANRLNAQLSTGPITEEGKAAAVRNALTNGLYTKEDYVKPEERNIYLDFRENISRELDPIGILENALAQEIAGATWRLRRCTEAEAELGAFSESTDKPRRSIERARAASHSQLHRSINQLRKLQTERLTRAEITWDNPEEAPLGESLKVVKVLTTQLRNDNLVKKLDTRISGASANELASNCKTANAGLIATKTAAKTAGSGQQIPRNAHCPCNSGNKYKRCCGKDAPPVLGKAA